MSSHGSKDKETFEGKSVIIFIPINLNMCFGCGCSKELSHWDNIIMFRLKNKTNFQLHSYMEAWAVMGWQIV